MMSQHAPNILVIMTDQMTPFMMGTYGHRTVKTPNLDRLAQRGTRQAMHRNKTYWDYQPHFDATQQYMLPSADDPYMRK